MSAKIGVVIIALNPSSLNVYNLRSELNTRGLSDVHTLKAITPRDLSSFSSESLDSLPSWSISTVEQAISHSHHQARLFAREKEWDWTLILEEDAILSGTKESLDLVFQELSLLQLDQVPAAIHLFPEQHGLLALAKGSCLCKVYWVPDYAVGYLLNFSAIQKTTKLFYSHNIQVADWPDFIRRLNWWAPIESWVLHPLVSEEISATQRTRKISQLGLSFTEKLFSKGYWVGFFLPYLGKMFGVYGSHSIPNSNLRSILIKCPRAFEDGFDS